MLNLSDVWMRGLDNFKTGVDRNVVPSENAKNLMDCSEIKRNSVTRNDITRSLINRISKKQVTFFGHVMRRKKLEHLVTTGMIEGKCSWGKQHEKMLDGLTKWLKVW